MIETFRQFEVGPDPYGRHWQVHFRWLQNGISIRHADTVDVKFGVSVDGEPFEERVVALPHPSLLALSKQTGQPLTDAWCMKIAALHLQRMILTDEDTEKMMVTLGATEMAAYARELPT